MYLAPVRQLTACQRVLIVALALIPLIMVTVASLPAFTVLPLLPGGIRHSSALITHLRRWTDTVLAGSGPAGCVANR